VNRSGLLATLPENISESHNMEISSLPKISERDSEKGYKNPVLLHIRLVTREGKADAKDLLLGTSDI